MGWPGPGTQTLSPRSVDRTLERGGGKFCPRLGRWDNARLAGLHHQPPWLEPVLLPESSCGGDSMGTGKGWSGSRRSAAQGEVESLATFPERAEPHPGSGSAVAKLGDP